MLIFLIGLLIALGGNPPLVARYTQSTQTVAEIAPYERPKPKVTLKLEDLETPPDLSFSARHRKGSGVFVRKDGVLLTAAHVVRGTTLARIETNDGRVYRATVIARDSALDIALLKITSTGGDEFVTASIGVMRPHGWPVYAIGNPAWFRNVITAGVVSTYDYEARRLVSDAFIEHGSSGGGLYDATNGQLLGITVELYKAYSASIPTDEMRRFLDKNMALAGAQ